MLNKKLLQNTLFFLSDDDFNDVDDFYIETFIQHESNIHINPDQESLCYWNIYELAIGIKEYIESYAKELGLSGVWIDLNDLSKDEAYYFKHCNEVFEGLQQYELIIESEQL